MTKIKRKIKSMFPILSSAPCVKFEHMHGIDVCAYCAEGDMAIKEVRHVKNKLKDAHEALRQSLNYFSESIQDCKSPGTRQTLETMIAIVSRPLLDK